MGIETALLNALVAAPVGLKPEKVYDPVTHKSFYHFVSPSTDFVSPSTDNK